MTENSASAEQPAAAPAPAPWFEKHRPTILRLALELAVVFIGVTAAFAMENWRSDAAEQRYRSQMIAALSQSIEGLAAHNQEIQHMIGRDVSAFDAALARGERPAPPVYREQGAERPPRAFDGIVATGVARSLSPDLYFRLVEYFNRVDSWGDRYARYTVFTEERVLPNMNGEDTSAFYTPNGELRSEYREYVNRLRDLGALSQLLADNAVSMRAELDEEIAH